MESKIIVALDFDSESKTLAFVDRVDPAQCRVKVGKELFTRCGPALVKQLVARNFDVFLDLKFHDIPNTVAHAVAAAADLGVWMTNVHASGGREMMVAARDAVATLNPGDRPLVIAVT
ncbi:MAG: orotidine 5'-phosphate decarboxylase, partial [OM182 bacterium]|nr:orotidine 5'-phosphate decarboxylase [OM182 bacterium]